LGGVKLFGFSSLPLSVNPCFVAIVAHLMGDGSDRITADGAARYAQHNSMGLRRFEEKLESAFGTPDRNLFGSDGTTVFIPKSVLLILKRSFPGVKFGTYESFIPDAIKLGDEFCRLSFLSAFLVDEGALYESISTRMKNRRLVEDVSELAVSLGYSCSRLKFFKDHTGTYVYGFDIKTRSAQKLLDDVRRLSRKFPACDLAQKQAQLEYLASLSHDFVKDGDGESKEKIVCLLAEKPRTAMELARALRKCRRTIRNHLSDLEVKNIVFNDGIKGRAKAWALNHSTTGLPTSCSSDTNANNIE
jgi:hypothetical protein